MPCVATAEVATERRGQQLGADGVQARSLELEPLLDAVHDVGRHVDGEDGRAVGVVGDERSGVADLDAVDRVAEPLTIGVTTDDALDVAGRVARGQRWIVRHLDPEWHQRRGCDGRWRRGGVGQCGVRSGGGRAGRGSLRRYRSRVRVPESSSPEPSCPESSCPGSRAGPGRARPGRRSGGRRAATARRARTRTAPRRARSGCRRPRSCAGACCAGVCWPGALRASGAKARFAITATPTAKTDAATRRAITTSCRVAARAGRGCRCVGGTRTRRTARARRRCRTPC